MLQDAKVCAALEQEFPDLDFSGDACRQKGIYGYLSCLSERASQWMAAGQLLPLERCVAVLNKLYRHCSRRVQSAIENVFLYHFTRSLHRTNRRWEIKQLLPVPFRDVIYRHAFGGAI